MGEFWKEKRRSLGNSVSEEVERSFSRDGLNVLLLRMSEWLAGLSESRAEGERERERERPGSPLEQCHALSACEV